MNQLFTVRIQHLCAALGFLLLAGCFGHTQKPSTLSTNQKQQGIASWYGPGFYGKSTASGEPYNMWAMTAAHQTLPFGTWVKVKKVSTGKAVTVQINDRGPFVKGRIIDLSYAAARELTIIGDGTAKVTLTILDKSQASIPLSQTNKKFWVQAGKFSSLREAMVLRERLAHDYAGVQVKTVNLSSGELHRVQIGSFESEKRAQTVVRALKNYWGIEAAVTPPK